MELQRNDIPRAKPQLETKSPQPEKGADRLKIEITHEPDDNPYLTGAVTKLDSTTTRYKLLHNKLEHLNSMKELNETDTLVAEDLRKELHSIIDKLTREISDARRQMIELEKRSRDIKEQVKKAAVNSPEETALLKEFSRVSVALATVNEGLRKADPILFSEAEPKMLQEGNEPIEFANNAPSKKPPGGEVVYIDPSLRDVTFDEVMAEEDAKLREKDISKATEDEIDNALDALG